MKDLPPELRQLVRKCLFVKGTRVPVYRLLDILATPDGDVSKIANFFNDVNEPELREAFHNCARLLKTLFEMSSHKVSSEEKTPVADGKASSAPSQRISLELAPEAKELLEKADRVKVFVDGTSRGNPGPSAYAFVFKDVRDNLIWKEGEYLGKATGNFAEATGIVKALERALRLGKKKVHLFSDSQLLIKQILGEYKIKNPDLKKLHARIQELRKKFEVCQFVNISREKNREADKLARLVLKKAMENREDNTDTP